MSWITLDDAVAALQWLLLRSSLAGAVNLAAPEPVTNAVFTAALAELLGRPAIVPVPRAALLLLFGEMAEATLLASQRASSRRLEADGFWFAYPDIVTGLRRAVAG
jgi:NAD dependent epimerase/dehydratase family enzyme